MATGTADWAEARRIAEIYERADCWTRKAKPQPVVPPVAPEPTRITLADAIKVYLATREATVAYPTFRKYKTFTKQLQTFAESLGYVMLDQFRPADIDVFYTKSKLGPRSKAKMLERLRGFFRFAVHREWISTSPVSPDLRPPAGSSRAANKMPFRDEQVAGILKACDRFEDRAWANRFGAGVWTGEDLKEFVWVLLYTGLRISDVVLFDMERLRGNEAFLRAMKNGGDVFTYIPDWLRDRLHARSKRCGPKPYARWVTFNRVKDDEGAAFRSAVPESRRRDPITGFPRARLLFGVIRGARHLPMPAGASVTIGSGSHRDAMNPCVERGPPR